MLYSKDANNRDVHNNNATSTAGKPATAENQQLQGRQQQKACKQEQVGQQQRKLQK